jgi:type VI protein secretion system component Hcp
MPIYMQISGRGFARITCDAVKRDVATGQASGKRQWKPLRIVYQPDASAPALRVGQLFAGVHFEFTTAGGGVPSSVRLANVRVVENKPHVGPLGPYRREVLLEYETVREDFQQIEWEWQNGGKTGWDDWAT